MASDQQTCPLELSRAAIRCTFSNTHLRTGRVHTNPRVPTKHVCDPRGGPLSRAEQRASRREAYLFACHSMGDPPTRAFGPQAATAQDEERHRDESVKPDSLEPWASEPWLRLLAPCHCRRGRGWNVCMKDCASSPSSPRTPTARRMPTTSLSTAGRTWTSLAHSVIANHSAASSSFKP